jgi:hypothetical protein
MTSARRGSSLAEILSLELAVEVHDDGPATLTSAVIRAKRYLREADQRRQEWLEKVRVERSRGGRRRHG